MKLLCIFATLLAISLARDIRKLDDDENIEDLEAAASIELLKTDQDALASSASSYSYATADSRWNDKSYNNDRYYPQTRQNNYVPPVNNYVPQNNYVPPQNNYVPPQNNYNPPQNNYIPPQNNYVPPQNDYVPPQNNYVPSPPQNNYVPPFNNYVPTPPQSNYVPPVNNYIPPVNNFVPPQNNYVPPLNNQLPTNDVPQAPPISDPVAVAVNDPSYNPQNTWTSTTPNPIIKNEQSYGNDGSYKYEYQIIDGTHVGEEGFIVNPNTENANLVKKGWYSYPGADGKIYTVTYYADHTGYHAFGEHLPTPPPVPAAIQAALDQAAKEEAAKAEAEKNKPQNPPQQTYYPQQPQQTYPQQNYPQQNYPQQTYPQQTYPQQTYPQQTYPQQTYPQQNYPQQNYPQQNYPNQQQNYYRPGRKLKTKQEN